MRRSTFAALIVLGALVVGILGPGAHAAGTVGSFEIDGNRPDSPAGEPLDWSSVPDVKSFTDLKKSNRDDVYKDGSKALEPGGWACATKSAPPKDDIVSAAIALRRVGTDRFMYVNWQRYSTNGTANVDYEFSQSNQEVCPGLPVRTEGDIILTYDFDNGGNTILIRAFRWHFTGDGVGVYVEDDQNLIEHETYDAAVNPGGASPPNEGNLAQGAFGEASINLTRTIGDICPRFASAYVRTRSSTSITSDPKDRTQKRSDICPPPQPTISKEAVGSVVEVGGNVTFNITYGNSAAEGVANTATISDTLPPGTEFVSCTGGCTQSGNTVTWQVGPIPPGGGGTVQLTLKVLQVPSGCMLCNTATIDSPQKAGSPDASDEGCIRVSPGPAPTSAHANGEAIGVHISDTGLGIDQTYTDVTSTLSGPGANANDAALGHVRIPTNTLMPPILEFDVVRGVAVSKIGTTPQQSNQESFAQVAGLNILNGVVKAELVRSAANAHAIPDGSSWTTNGTGTINLNLDQDGSGSGQPQLMDNVNPGALFNLDSLFGKNGNEHSLVTFREVSGSTTGTYVSDVTVTMIHIHAVDRDPILPGRQTTDIFISRSISHADHPAGQGCPGSVSGHAFLASATTDPDLIPAVVGYVTIPAYGGHDSANLTVLNIPADGSTVHGGVAEDDSVGTLTATTASSTDFASVANVCIVRTPTGGCTVGAALAKSQAASSGSGSSVSSNDTGTQLIGLTVNGTPININGTPAPNTTINLPAGLGFIVLNEHLCDSPASFAVDTTCAGTQHSGLTVRMIRVVLLDPAAGGLPGAEVIVSEAHSDATLPT